MKSKDEELREEMKYVMRCLDCGGTDFNALRTGHISCVACGLTYMFVHAEPFKDWVYTAMDPTDFIKQKKKKIWDEDKKEFRPIPEVEEKNRQKKKKDKEDKDENKDL